MSEEDYHEKRIHPRTPIELKVEYKKVNTFFYDYTRNISKGGTFIKTVRPLDVGTCFLFKLTVPHLEEPLVFNGQVIWVVTEEDAGKDPTKPTAGMGIRFVYESDSDRHAVEETVEKLMVSQLGGSAYEKLMKRNQE